MKSQSIYRFVAVTVLAALPVVGAALDFTITPTVQSVLDKEKITIAHWAADPIIVKAVKEQNRKGPIPGMDNAKWKHTRRFDPLVKQFQNNAAGKFLRDKMRESKGEVTEAFLNGSHGEKVAFGEKTTSYFHTNAAKHKVPFTTGKSWQGKPEFDESSQTYAVQISVPVLDRGAPIGSLVVGVNLSYLEKVAR